MTNERDTVDLTSAGRALRDKQADLHARLGVFTATPERGSNLGFGKRIGDGTIEAVDRLNQVGVGSRLESRLERQLLLLGEATAPRPEPEGRPVAERGRPPGGREPGDDIEFARAALAKG